MTFDARVEAVAAMGFTARQATFLVHVALHSGYCVRRQYARFAGLTYGKNVRAFLDALVAKRLAVRFSIRADRGHLYHLQARTLYRVVGDEDCRHRREGSAALIARKLMILDYVLAHREVEWLATEEDKVKAFTTRFNLSRADLPQRVSGIPVADRPQAVRYFPQNLPLAVTGPVVQFVSLVTDTTGRGLEQFLQDHAALLRHLAGWSVTAIGPAPTLRLANCEGAFARFLRSPIVERNAHSDDLKWYLHTRRSVDGGQLSALSMGDIERFRQLHGAYQATGVDALYRSWILRGEEALAAAVAGSGRRSTDVGRLITESLPFDYSQFGSLPGVA